MRVALTLAAFLLAASGAQAAVLDFEAFTAGQPVTSVTFGDGTTATVTTVSNRSGGSNMAGIFDTDNPTGNDQDLAAPFTSGSGGPILSPGNILIILGPNRGFGTPDDDALGGSITFAFSRPVDLIAFDYFDTEEGVTATADTGQSSGPLVLGDAQYDRHTSPFLGIKTLTFTLGGSGGIDNLQIASIPVPAALSLLLGALGALWVLGRTRRSA